MGKGNRNRGDDRGDDKSFAQRSFGGTDQKFRGTIGGALGQAEKHADACFGAIKGVRNVRAKIDAQEKVLSENPEFVSYIKAKREMLELEERLNKLPSFVEYQKTRKELRAAVNKLNEEKPKCSKCSFADHVKVVQPAETPAAAAAA